MPPRLFRFVTAAARSRTSQQHLCLSRIFSTRARMPLSLETVLDYVDDSEPERQESRRRHKAIKKGKSIPTQPSRSPTPAPGIPAQLNAPSPAPNEVIELSDAEDERAVIKVIERSSTASAVTSKGQVIDISDDASNVSLHSLSGAPAIAIYAASSAPGSPIRTKLLLSALDMSPDLRTKLGHLAYTQDPPRLSRGSSLVSASSSAAESAAEGQPPVKRTRKTKPPLVPDLTAADLALLMVCPSCGISWTTRKTAQNKLTHIRSCARKRGLSQDALQAMLLRELKKAVESNMPESKTPPTVPKLTAPGTFMEDVVNVADPKRKARRKDVQLTVKGLGETRNVILNRARSLLANTDPGPSMPVGPMSLNGQIQTQAFGQSALAQRHGFTRSERLDYAGPSTRSEDNDDAPPATQAFAPSKLRAALGRTSHISVATSSDDDDTHRSISSSREHSPRQALMSPSDRLSFRSPGHRLSTRGLPHQLADEQQDLWTYDGRHRVQDDVGLEWPMEPNHNVYLRSNLPSERGSPVTLSLTQTHCEVAASPKPTLSKPKGKARRMAKKQLGVDDDEAEEADKLDDPALFKRLKQLIIQDNELHLRILRYEPVDFNVFLALAETLNVSSRGLKLKVRAFLDEQAINFFGAELASTRTKRHA
ncbi:hypothetical protein FA95DRAFT_1552905, partial [Auriscalpium vulgare]